MESEHWLRLRAALLKEQGWTIASSEFGADTLLNRSLGFLRPTDVCDVQVRRNLIRSLGQHVESNRSHMAAGEPVSAVGLEDAERLLRLLREIDTVEP